MLLEITKDPKPLQIVAQVVSDDKDKFVKAYKLPVKKINSMKNACLFSGRDIFKMAKTNECNYI